MTCPPRCPALQPLLRRRPRPVPALLSLLVLASQAAALDLNRATQAELESLRGVGPGLSAAVLQARAERPFADWRDLEARVPGLGERSARRLSDQGGRVQGQPHPAALRPAASAP
ncbi:ComEA family DNA-binding protein [Aquabacterium sp. J223]|uniref:ComEA family DNA-binding protein n=1 Tax=Aquabacterium sp. J223 TaxID=2898431 RepID=UPI0021ADFDDD|nr:helix-hairpin-helix domain-containing protein [Aquabacterium sp. J223]UUX97503.1 helix-hairpin-helix domain-containing protein [Aquabacterium sp. J223]